MPVVNVINVSTVYYSPLSPYLSYYTISPFLPYYDML